MANDAGLPALSRRLNEIRDLYTGDLTTCGHAVGKGARTATTAAARSVSGGDGVLSHMGRRGARLGMRYEVEQQGRLVFIKLVPAGPWVLVQKGAKPHTIKPRRARLRGGGSGWGIDPAVYAPSYDHPTRVPVHHPGAPGRDGIQRAFVSVRERASRDFHEAYVAKLAKVMA